MILDFEVVPYIGAGPIRLGMSRSDLHNILGKPSYVDDGSSGGDIFDSWGAEGISITFSNLDGEVRSIGFDSHQHTASIRKRRFFDRPGDEVYRELCRLDGAPRYDVGLTVLFKLGIMLGGFQTTDQDERTVCAFARGVFKEDDPELRPIKV